MKNKCKYLVGSTRGWPKKLIDSCYELETFVEGVEYTEISNSFSDHQPSYQISKQIGNRRYSLIVKPRMECGEMVFYVEDEVNRSNNKFNSLPSGVDSFTEYGPPSPGDFLNPHIWDFDKLKYEILNIDMTLGFTREVIDPSKFPFKLKKFKQPK